MQAHGSQSCAIQLSLNERTVQIRPAIMAAVRGGAAIRVAAIGGVAAKAAAEMGYIVVAFLVRFSPRAPVLIVQQYWPLYPRRSPTCRLHAR